MRNLTATEKMKRSREMTKRMAARELVYAAILARIWPSYLAQVARENPEYPLILCVESPAGMLTWRLSTEEAVFFADWLQERENNGERASDRDPTLMALAEGWK